MAELKAMNATTPTPVEERILPQNSLQHNQSTDPQGVEASSATPRDATPRGTQPLAGRNLRWLPGRHDCTSMASVSRDGRCAPLSVPRPFISPPPKAKDLKTLPQA